MKRICLLLACIAIICGCKNKPDTSGEYIDRIVFAMDTEMTLLAGGEDAGAALEAAEDEIRRQDATLSRGSEGSEIYAINKNGGGAVCEDTATIIETALDICNSTNGAFDITIAPVMDLWGFYTKDFRVPTDDELSEGLEKVDYKNVVSDGGDITLLNGAQVDLGGIAKGYLSGRIMEIFKDHGVESGIVSLGGNVQALGTRSDGDPWRVAIQSPDKSSYICVLEVCDKAVITSGGYERYFDEDGMRYHHIIDPKTGLPADSGVTSVTIVSDNAALADGLSTAMFVMGLDAAAEYWRTHDGFEAVFLTDDNKIYITDGLIDSYIGDKEYTVIDKNGAAANG